MIRRTGRRHGSVLRSDVSRCFGAVGSSAKFAAIPSTAILPAGARVRRAFTQRRRFRHCASQTGVARPEVSRVFSVVDDLEICGRRFMRARPADCKEDKLRRRSKHRVGVGY
jgi:hypothetical protein